MKSARLGLIWIIGLLATASHAWEVREPGYLSSHLFDDAVSGQVLPAMPQHGSPEEKADFATLFNFQKTRTPKDCERAGYEVHISLENEFGPKYGPLTEKEVKAWGPFFENIAYETDYFVQKFKKHFHRPRPYVIDSGIQPCVERETSEAYPSGHAAINRVFALVLDRLDPSRKAAFDARGDQIAEDRVLAGVHHPSDIEAGKNLGNEIFAALIQNEKFQKDLKVVKKISFQ